MSNRKLLTHSGFNSYAPELVPICYYRDKTRVQMFLQQMTIRGNTRKATSRTNKEKISSLCCTLICFTLDFRSYTLNIRNSKDRRNTGTAFCNFELLTAVALIQPFQIHTFCI